MKVFDIFFGLGLLVLDFEDQLNQRENMILREGVESEGTLEELKEGRVGLLNGRQLHQMLVILVEE